MSEKSKIAVLIVAGGRGARVLGAVNCPHPNNLPKQYMEIGHETLLRKSVRIFLEDESVDLVQVVIHKDDVALYEEALSSPLPLKDSSPLSLWEKGATIEPPILGGKTRQESVHNGLLALKKYNPDFVLIHDAARPFATVTLTKRVIDALTEGAVAVIPALPATDTIKKVSGNKIEMTLDRRLMVQAQTPQGFQFQDILKVHGSASANVSTDDAALMEEAGFEVITVEGDVNNFKITTSDDLNRARLMVENLRKTRVGMGFDVHAFIPYPNNCEKYITLCGIKVESDKKLKGHSDADVALHAVVDALLGAISEGDIGTHFPPSDDKWKGADSAVFVKHTCELLKKHNVEINHIDITIIGEKPKITPYREAMRKRLSELLEVDIRDVSIKATTTEKLGFLGREEGLAAQAIATVVN